MKVRLVDQIKCEDALILGMPGADLGRFSEWHHFNFTVDEEGLYGIVNLALSGNIYKGSEARAGVSLVVYEWQKGWHGTVNLYPLQDARFMAGSIDLQIGGNWVKFKKNKYEVKAALRDRSIQLLANFTPAAAPVRLDNIGGRVSTFVAPRTLLDGEITVNGLKHKLTNGSGYHDHNWGYWHWGKEIGWDWGFIVQPPALRKKKKDPSISIVFGRVTDANHRAKSDLVLITWLNDKFCQAFMDKAVSISYSGELKGVRIPRIPGPMDLLDPRQPAGIPRQIKIVVEEDEDRLIMLFNVAGAAQFLIPHPVWKAVTTITEMVGTYEVAGQIRGHQFDFSYNGFAEVAG